MSSAAWQSHPSRSARAWWMRVRKGPSNSAAEQPLRKPVAAGVPACCTGNEGIVVRSISCRSKHGASHRKNFDTPSLGRELRRVASAPGLLVEPQRLRRCRALQSAPLRDDPGPNGREHPVRESVRRDRRCPGLYAPDGPLAILLYSRPTCSTKSRRARPDPTHVTRWRVNGMRVNG
jgi:hypothetical protein